MTALMYAAGWDHFPTLEALLECGAKVDMRDNLGRSALTWAARKGRDDAIVKRLIKAGSKVELADAMMLKDYPKVKEILLESKKVKAFGPFGDNLLMMAAENAQLDIVKEVLKRGVSVNARDDKGMTALMLAVEGRPTRWIPSDSESKLATAESPVRAEIIRRLLDHHANPNLRNRNRDSALSIAEQVHFSSAIELLRTHDSRLNPKRFHSPNAP